MRKRTSGMALFMVLVLISILGLFTGLVAGQQGLSLGSSGVGGEREQAYFVAMGALNRGLSELRSDSGWPGINDAPFPGSSTALFDVEVVENAGAAPMPTSVGVDLPPGFSVVIATGKVGDAHCTVAGLLGHGSSVGAGYAAISTWYTQLLGGTVDAFTTTGSFKTSDLQSVPNKAQLASINDKVKMSAQWTPNGDVPTRVDGKIASDRVDGDDMTPDPTVYVIDALSSFGGETQTTDPPALDPLPTMSFLGGPRIQVIGATQTITPGQYDNLFVCTGGEVYLEAGDYYFANDVHVQDNGRVHTNGPVKIFIKNALAVIENGALNFEGDPRNCEVFVESANCDILDTATLMGRLRAPNATVTIFGEVYGDVQGKMVRVERGPVGVGAIHYFADLGAASPEPGDASLTYRSMWVVGGRQAAAETM